MSTMSSFKGSSEKLLTEISQALQTARETLSAQHFTCCLRFTTRTFLVQEASSWLLHRCCRCSIFFVHLHFLVLSHHFDCDDQLQFFLDTCVSEPFSRCSCNSYVCNVIAANAHGCDFIYAGPAKCPKMLISGRFQCTWYVYHVYVLCIHTYRRACVHTYICTYVHVYARAWVHCMSICTGVHTYTICAYMNARNTRMRICMRIYTYAYAYAYTYRCAWRYTVAYKNICARTWTNTGTRISNPLQALQKP
jgi:hypothetical protein